MRKTLDIPDPTYRKLKAKAAQLGCSVEDLILRSVDSRLSNKPRKRRRVHLPLLRSSQPGTLFLTNQQIYRIIPFP